jgi:Cyclopropane fatty acid synthase and related methyltransferases
MSTEGFERLGELELDPHARAVARYFDDNWLPLWFWMTPRNLSMHYGWYDPSARTHLQAMIRTNEVMAEAADISPGQRVLDAGCGIGGSSLWLARMRQAECVGVTLSANQVRRARHHARLRRLDHRVTYLQRDFRRTGLAARSFDVVWAEQTVGHNPNQSEFVQEAFRLLKPGGRLIIQDGYQMRQMESPEEEALMRACQQGWAAAPFPTLEEFQLFCKEAGFVDVKSQDINENLAPSVRRTYRMCRTFLPLSRTLHPIRLGKLQPWNDTRHANIVGTIAAWRSFERGLWRFFMTRAVRPT